MDQKQLIEHLVNGIYEEIERNKEVVEFEREGNEVWNYRGKFPNKSRFNRYRLMLDESLRKVEKSLRVY